MRNKKIGNIGEHIVANRLIEQGFQIVGRQVWTRYGEVDIVASKPSKILFVEVKTRTNAAFGMPETAINDQKRDHMHKAALSLVQRMHITCDWEMVVYAVELNLQRRTATCSRFSMD